MGKMGIVRHFLGPLTLISTLPILIQCVSYTMIAHKGSFLAFFVELITTRSDYLLLHVVFPGIPSLRVVGIVAIFAAIQLLLLIFVPGETVYGPITPAGARPSYIDNGFKSLLISLSIWIGASLTGIIEGSFVIDNLQAIVLLHNVTALLLSFTLIVKGALRPPGNRTVDSETSGSVIFDWYIGLELHPKIFSIDVKQYVICRYGMVAWAMFALSGLYQCQSWNQIVSVTLQILYIIKFSWWERYYYRAADIAVDKMGFMLTWGCITFMPLVHTLQNTFIAMNQHATFDGVESVFLIAFGVFCIWLNYDSDTQRHRARELELESTSKTSSSSKGKVAKVEIWGRPAVFIPAKYTTANGKVHRTVLLASGYHGLCRHFHYLPDIILLVLYCAPAGWNHILPFTYAIYLSSLLIDRTYRIDKKCAEKYGDAWVEYVRRVPYRLIPFIW